MGTPGHGGHEGEGGGVTSEEGSRNASRDDDSRMETEAEEVGAGEITGGDKGVGDISL